MGPGLGNGIANLHNAKKARTPIVNIVGDHAKYHLRYETPLKSDIAALAGVVSKWVRVCASPAEVAADCTEAVAAALQPPSGVATLVLPADTSWEHFTATPARARPASPASVVPKQTIDRIGALLRSGEPAMILLGGASLREPGLHAAAAIAASTGAKVLIETMPSRLERGGDLPRFERLGYLPEMAMAQLANIRQLILVDVPPPVCFFAYPGKPSELWPQSCELHTLAGPEHDVGQALAALAAAIGRGDPVAQAQPLATRPARPTGPLDAKSLAAAVGSLLPEGAIVVDESNTEGLFLPAATASAPRHDWLCLTGGAIGQGAPVATGAAVAAPERPVLCIVADGSAMYTIQALWTQVRENLNVTTLVLSNRSYAILNLELARVGAGSGARASSARAKRMIDLTEPSLDFVSLANGMGIQATRATTADELVVCLERALNTPGPSLIEAVLPPGLPQM
jgi:acetolactate synthase-1/2/3 large subunit